MKAALRQVGKFLVRVVFCGAGALAFLLLFAPLIEVDLPDFARKQITRALSSEKFHVSVRNVAIRFPRTISISGLKVLDRTKKEAAPFLSADRVDVRLTFSRLPWSLRNALKEVVVWGLKFPRLPDGYYIPDSIEFPGSPDFRETNEPVVFTFPTLNDFHLRLVRPDVLAVRADVVDMPHVRMGRNALVAEDVLLEWPDSDAAMSLDGELAVNIDRQCVRGSVHGQARQPNVRPMLEALEITNSYPFIDAFTGVTTPVDATCKFDVNLCNNDLHIFLDLHPSTGAYRGVPFTDVHGTVDIRVFVRDVYQNAVITVGPLMADLADGRRLSGSVVYENTNDVGYVNFDCKTTTSLSNALAIANTLNDGTLDCLYMEDPGEITLRGVLAVDPRNAATNDLSGSVTFKKGSFFGIPLRDVFSLYALRGTDASFANAHATTRRGGTVDGSAVLNLPDFREDKARFHLDLVGTRIPLEDLADAFALDLGDRSGSVSGTLKLDGPFGTNVVPRLSGGGSFVCENGNLARFRFFAGFFDALAKVPGLATVMHVTSDQASVSMAKASADFVVAEGLLKVSNFRVDGSTFSIEGGGTYDMTKDELDFDLLLRLKKDTFIGTLARTISWTLPNFFAFKVYGPLDKAKWRPSSPDWKNVISNPLE